MSEFLSFEALQEDFSDIINYDLVDIVVDETMIDHKIIVLSACNFPNNSEIDHNRLLRYLTYALDKHVNRNYVLVYFHYGLTGKNMPPLKWLWHAYGVFNRKYKKNLKTLYVVHPTSSIKLFWKCFKSLHSKKFQRKIIYVDDLLELKQYLNLDQIVIPTPVLNHNNKIMVNSDTRDRWLSSALLPTQQFGVSLRFIKANNNAHMIPPLVRKCIEHLDRPDALSTEKLFGKSINVSEELKNRINRDKPMNINIDDVHLWAALLLTFLRELEEPLMTYEMFDEIIRFKLTPDDKCIEQVKIMIVERLPIHNYYLLKYIIQFVSKVADNFERNKMNSFSLAMVFGPVLIRKPFDKPSIKMLSQIIDFIHFIILNHKQLF